MTTWLILGATSAIARAFALEAASHGVRILVAARDVAELEPIASDIRLRTLAAVDVLRFDAGRAEDRAALVAYAKAAPAPISVFVGFGSMPTEEAMRKDSALFADMVANNFTAAGQVLNELTPLLEAQKAGAVVVVGSVAGDRGRKSNYQYGAAKAAVAAFVGGLAARLSSFNVPVLLVKPGPIDTAMTWGLKGPPLPMGAPGGLAKAIWRKVPKGGVIYYPLIWWPIMRLIQHLPRKVFNKLNF